MGLSWLILKPMLTGLKSGPVRIGLCLLAGIELAGGATFTATLEPQRVSVGESANLTLTFDVEPKAPPKIPSLENLQIEGPASSQQTTVVNNRVSSTFSLIYQVTPMRPGEYLIPALRAQVEGEELSSQPLKLVAAQGEQLAFFKLVIPRKEIYVGEVFSVELQLHVRNGIYNAGEILQSFDQIGGSPLKAEGFTVLRTAHARRRQVQVDGNVYHVATLVTALSPLKTGSLALSSVDAKFTVQIPVASARFGGLIQEVQNRQVALETGSEGINVLELPKQNVPTNFTGAVGTYSLNVSGGPTNVAIGDPITVRIQLSGTGALESLSLPDPLEWRDFKSVSQRSQVDLTDPLGTQGSKTFEQVLIPQSAAIQSLPPVAFSFFDPQKKDYQTLVQAGVPLVVRPSGAAAPTPSALSARSAAESPATPDIVHIKQRLGPVGTAGAPLVLRPWFLACQAIPVLILGGVAVWRKRADELSNNPRLRRRKRVARIITEGLVDLHQQAGRRDSEAFFATLFRLLQEQLGERLDLPASSITEAVIEEHLRPAKASQKILDPLQALFQACNLARYAPVRSSQELQLLIPQTEALLAELQRFER